MSKEESDITILIEDKKVTIVGLTLPFWKKVLFLICFWKQPLFILTNAKIKYSESKKEQEV